MKVLLFLLPEKKNRSILFQCVCVFPSNNYTNCSFKKWGHSSLLFSFHSDSMKKHTHNLIILFS